MARVLVAASSQYIEVASAVVASPPFTMAYWFRVTNTTARHLGMAMFATSGIGYHYLGPRGDIAGDPVQVITDNGVGTGAASTSTSFAANTWHHACGVFTSTSSRTAYLDGGGAATNTTTSSFTPSRTGFGRMYYSGSPFGSYDGRVAHAAIWNVALDGEDVASLAAGFCPLLVRPASLVAYWPLGGFHGDYDRDLIGGYNLTPSGLPTFADQSRIIYPQGPHGVQLAASSPPAATPWLYARRSARIIGGGLS